MSDKTDSLAKPKEQSQPTVFLKLHRNHNQELKGIDDTKYYDICTPAGHVCSKIGLDNLDWSDNNNKTEDEEEEAQPAEKWDWDADLEQAPDYCARPPILMKR